MENTNENVNNVATLLFCQFEACCYFEVSKALLNQNSYNSYTPKYGCENGFSSFVMLSMIIDLALFIYEAIKTYETIMPGSSKEIKEFPEYHDIKELRNNIHTFYKRGSYKEKANTIIHDKLSEYKMLEPDLLYPLRNDISLIFLISSRSRHLIGCDYVIKHYIYDTKREWRGDDHKRIAEFIGSFMQGFVNSVDETAYNVPPLPYQNNEVRIELFDYKSYDLFKRISASQATTFRILLILSQISYGILFIDYLIDTEKAIQSDLWACFLAKVLSIKYDEAFDNLYSLRKHSSEIDRDFIDAIFKTGNIEFSSLKSRTFAQGLRNTIHNQSLDIDMDNLEDNTTVSWIKAMYLSSSKVKTMNEFRILSGQLLNELRLLQESIQKTLGLDKVYSY